MQDLTVAFDVGQRDTLLADWQWLIGKHRLPILFTASGNAFVQDVNDGSIHLLDTGEGRLKPACDSADQLRHLLDDVNFVIAHFDVNAIGQLKSEGRELAAGQVWSFIHPPVLGGSFDTDNYEPTDLAVHFSIQGQIHRQVKDLPDGAAISSIQLK
ncbi:MAG: DUF1851 domain-containing protein [Burkholderiales bacterium]|nr:DUF1851 domain-containing protein [Burkholderiales bacterium]